MLKSKLCNSSAISSAGCHTLNPYWGLLQLQNPERSLLRAASRHNAEAHCDITILPNRCRYRAHHLRHMKYLYFSTGQRRVQSLAYLWPRWLTGAHAEVCAQPGCSIAWHNWANMILQVAADVATIQHIAHARDATSIGVTPATRGRNCAGNATGHGMNSTIVVSFSRDVGVLEAMADLSDDIEKPELSSTPHQRNFADACRCGRTSFFRVGVVGGAFEPIERCTGDVTCGRCLAWANSSC